MTDVQQLRTAVEDLIGVVHLLTEETQRLITHVEQQTIRVGYTNQISMVQSELSELHRRVKKMAVVTAS